MDNYFSKHLAILTKYQRYKSRVVNIGDVPLGGDHPIRIQSMTNTNTMDTEATVAQTISLINAGCEYVRITAPSVKEAENLGVIKHELFKQGYSVPLIADIHFVPRAAEVAARLVEKVRVNPGNYVDRKKFEVLEYSQSEYQAELDRIRERFTPLVKLCREEGTAMRIGSNHGSLSDRILNHYGDTPLGMVESAMEFVRICADENYHELVISMKASNTRIMVQAYRLLVDHMERAGFNYPLHLGVTEAGDGDDARLKSSLGIGSLLQAGFGDTIRVSLTESPEAEIPVAKAIVQGLVPIVRHEPINAVESLPIDLFSYNKRVTTTNSILGGDQAPVIVADLSEKKTIGIDDLKAIGYNYDLITNTWIAGDQAADILYMGSNPMDYLLPENTVTLYNSEHWELLEDKEHQYPFYSLENYMLATVKHARSNYVEVNSNIDPKELPHDPTIVWVLHSQNSNRCADMRNFMLGLIEYKLSQAVILKIDYEKTHRDDLLLATASEAGGLFIDGLGDGLWLKSSTCQSQDLNEIGFGVLQASRSRMTKTEYIACPSCGRTLFDLEEVTAQIRNLTSHLKGVKIGIMGCIVNGPGEMADADFGYVGTGPGKVSLYRGQMVVKPHIPQKEAVASLIELIKSEGFWVEPQ